MKNFDIEEEYKRTIVGTYTEYTKDDFKIVENKETKYLLRRPYYCVHVDEEGEFSYHEPFNYFQVLDYITTKQNIDTLDLTWMNPVDSFDFRQNEDNQKIKNIIVNIANLHNSFIYSFDNKINLIIKKGEQEQKTKASFINQLKAFNSFTRRESYKIAQIQLDGFNSLTNKILTKCAQSHNIKVTTVEKQQLNEMQF